MPTEPDARKTAQARYYAKNRETIAAKHARRKAERKMRVIAEYSGKCACCGEDNLAFLVMDHIDGGGNEHRRKIGRYSGAIYRWLIEAGFPEGFQVLCCNCNHAKYFLGICPHQVDKVNA